MSDEQNEGGLWPHTVSAEARLFLTRGKSHAVNYGNRLLMFVFASFSRKVT